VYYKCVKFHKNPISHLGGDALTRYMDGWTDGRTDRVIPIYPPNNMRDSISSKDAHKKNIFFFQYLPTASNMNIKIITDASTAEFPETKIIKIMLILLVSFYT
jgi:hypothetical protein